MRYHTRWSARVDAVKSLTIGFIEIQMALIQMHEDTNQKKSTRLKALNSFEFDFVTIILERINETSKSLQEIKNNLTVACKLSNNFHYKFKRTMCEIEEEAKNCILRTHCINKNKQNTERKKKMF